MDYIDTVINENARLRTENEKLNTHKKLWRLFSLCLLISNLGIVTVIKL